MEKNDFELKKKNILLGKIECRCYTMRFFLIRFVNFTLKKIKRKNYDSCHVQVRKPT